MAAFASSRARELAREQGVDGAEVAGTGRDGAVTVADVRAAVSDRRQDAVREDGRALLESVRAGLPDGWELDEREEAILLLAARQADDLAAVEAVVAAEGPMASGSNGQPVIHPAVLEARQARLAISRLLGQLGLPDHVGGTAGTEASRRGQRAATARWNREAYAS